MPTEVDIKLLWGRAASRCSICRRELTQDKAAVTASFVVGEHAHIIGEKPDAARGKSNLSLDERDGYHNRILLCPTHHTEIDKNPDDYTVERLHMIKSQHEVWVQNQLATQTDKKPQADALVYAHLINSAVTLCRLEQFPSWASFALSVQPSWDGDFPHDLYQFRRRVIGAVWPGTLPELERSIRTLSIVAHMAAQTFLENSRLDTDGTRCAYPFYKADGWNEHYDEDLALYKAWLAKCGELVEETGKAANWFANVVRRDINPLFFAKQGKFIVMNGPDIDLTFRTDAFEYSADKKARQPEDFCERQKREKTDPRATQELT